MEKNKTSKFKIIMIIILVALIILDQITKIQILNKVGEQSAVIIKRNT